jgi:hypothetical protein
VPVIGTAWFSHDLAGHCGHIQRIEIRASHRLMNQTDPSLHAAGDPGRLRRLWAFLHRPIGPGAARRQPAAAAEPSHMAMCEALRQALQRAGSSRAARRRWRRLDAFEAWLRRHGDAAMEKLPSGYLHRVNLQLQGLAAGNALLQALSARIEAILGRRMAAADTDQAPLSALEFSSLVEVDEIDGDEALREFAVLWAGDENHGASPGGRAVDNRAPCPSFPTPLPAPSCSDSTPRPPTT